MISVIIPTYNEEKYIGQTLAGLKSALTVPHELIVSDDKSTDNTVSVAGQYADLVHVPEVKHVTIAANRNAGAKLARGEILVFTDSSCMIQNPDAVFRRAIASFEADPDLVAITGKLGVLPEFETIGDRIVYFGFNIVHYVKNNILGMGEAPGKFQIIRKKSFDAVGGFREDLVTREDGNLFSRLSKIGRTHYDSSMLVLHSGRRAHKVGWVKLLYVWMLETFWVAAFGRSRVKDWIGTR